MGIMERNFSEVIHREDRICVVEGPELATVS